jgi:uncharacterized repeat protein (TIGR03843 family)
MVERGFAIGEDGARTWVSADDVHRLLARGVMVACEMIPWSSNYTFAARLSCDDHPDVLAVYKPRRGEVPLYDFPDGTLYKRERASYLTARALGWDFIPPTIIRDGPHGIGSVQLFVEPEPKADFFRYKDNHRAEIQRIALFDVIANNADRKAGHCLKALDGRIWGIDHGLTFNAVPKLRTVIWDFAGEPIPPPLLRQLQEFRCTPARVAALRRELEQLLNRNEVEIFFKRIDAVLDHRRYPVMSSRRSVPWPWF